MSFAYTKPRERLGDIQTPLHLSHFLFRTLKHLRPKVVLDPCVGRGNLIVPWRHPSRICIGVEKNLHVATYEDIVEIKCDFLSDDESVPKTQPDLVLCNPPWNRPCNDPNPKPCRNMPERFLRRIVDLYGKDVPIAFLCPMGFRLNQRQISKRWRWLSSSDAPKITSTIALPVDCFPDTQFHSEVILFNCRGVKPHYFLDYLVKDVH